MEYKNFKADITYSEEDNAFVGSLVLPKDSISFHADTVKDLEKEFHASVDRYISFCQKLGKEVSEETSSDKKVEVKSIPDFFRKYDNSESHAYTVGQLIEKLEQLPKDLEIHQGFGEGCRVAVIINAGTEQDELYFDEIEELDNEDD